MSEKVLGNLKQGLVFVLSAPAGTGKTTLVRLLIQEFPCVVQSISYTTRAPREGEIHGKDYNFITREEFEKKIKANEFLEYVNLYGDYYGTSLAWVNARLKEGKHVILVIDAQGGLQLLGKYPATFIFIKPPSLEVLRQRLLKRRTETLETLEKGFLGL